MQKILNKNTNEVFYGSIDKNLESLDDYELISIPNEFIDKEIKYNKETKKIEETFAWVEDKKKDLLSKLSIKIGELRSKGILVSVNGIDCYQKCRDEDDMAMKAIIFSMESLGETVKHNYRMFNAQGYSYWCSPTLEELKNIQAQCFYWVSNILYAEIRRIETEILSLTVENIDNYQINIEVI